MALILYMSNNTYISTLLEMLGTLEYLMNIAEIKNNQFVYFPNLSNFN